MQQKIIKGDVRVSRLISKLYYEGSVIWGNFSCVGTVLTSLKGSPSEVHGYFRCNNNNITSLEGAPAHVWGDFNCSYTNITSLHNIHKQIKHISGSLSLPMTIKSHMMGIMFIKGLKWINFTDCTGAQSQVEEIINKHLAKDRNIHDCQEELLESGLSEYAKV